MTDFRSQAQLLPQITCPDKKRQCATSGPMAATGGRWQPLDGLLLFVISVVHAIYLSVEDNYRAQISYSFVKTVPASCDSAFRRYYKISQHIHSMTRVFHSVG